MLATAALPDYILAIHILAVVIGFGATFTYPLFLFTGARMDPAAMPWFYRMMQLLTRWFIYPGLLVLLAAGIYLASKYDQFHAFYVQWGFFAVIVLGGVEGAVMAPRVRRLIALSERDLAGAASSIGLRRRSSDHFVFSEEYRKVFGQLAAGGTVQALMVIVTVFLMATHAGA